MSNALPKNNQYAPAWPTGSRSGAGMEVARAFPSKAKGKKNGQTFENFLKGK